MHNPTTPAAIGERARIGRIQSEPSPTGPVPLPGGVRGGLNRSEPVGNGDRARRGRPQPTPPSVGMRASGRSDSSGNLRTFSVVGEAPTTAGESPALPINSQPSTINPRITQKDNSAAAVFGYVER